MKKRWFALWVLCVVIVLAYFTGLWPKEVKTTHESVEEVPTRGLQVTARRNQFEVAGSDNSLAFRDYVQAERYTELIDEARTGRWSGDELWDLALTDGLPENMKRSLLYEAVGLLTNSYTASELLARVRNAMGPGQNMQVLTGEIFNKCMIAPQEALSLLDSLDFRDIRDYAAERYGDALARNREIDFEALQLLGNGVLAEKVIHRMLVKHPFSLNGEPLTARFERAERAVNLLLDLAGRNEYSSEFVSGVFGELGQKFPEIVLDRLEAAESGFSPSPDLLNSIVSSLARKDPKAALARISSEGTYQDLDLQGPLSGYLNIDSSEALSWLETNKNKLSAKHWDDASNAVAATALGRSEFDSAWEWASEIKDPERRATLERRIWREEREEVVRETRSHPEAFLEELTSPESRHAEFWLKEAFKAWLAESAGDANGWYGGRKGELSPQQSQHIARAYAEVALEQGDVALAREWSAWVVDPEFKQKLLNQIEDRAPTGSE